MVKLPLNSVKFYAASTVLAPVLLLQGKRVRAKTLRMPPPQGLRQGSVGCGKVRKLLLLGDSAAEGVGVAKQDDALLGQLINLLSANQQERTQQAVSYRVNYQLIAKTGDTIADIIAHLRQHIATGDGLMDLDLVVISAGVNDVTALTSLQHWQKQTSELIELLQTELRARCIIFTAIPPMQHFPALPFPLSRWLGLRADILNHALKRKLEDFEQVHFLKLETPVDTAYIAKDGFHPSAKTYALWASAVADILKQQAVFVGLD